MEELNWITLLICESYNPNAQTYLLRRMVRDVPVNIDYFFVGYTIFCLKHTS